MSLAAWWVTRQRARQPVPVPADPNAALTVRIDALGESIVALNETISGLAEVVRAALNREAP